MEIEQIEKLSAGYRAAKIFHTAIQANLFEYLNGGVSVEIMAEQASTDPKVTEHILNALVAMEIIQKKGDQFFHTEISRKYLTTESEFSRLNSLQHSATGWEKWSHLPSLLESGQLPDRTHTYDNPEHYRQFILAMHEIQRPHVREVVEALPLDAGKKILDCGGGPGTYARAFAATRSELEVTLFDLPEAIPIAQSLEGDQSLRYLSGDFFTDDLGGPYDGIFLSNIIHSWSAEENQQLLGRLSEALNPGGWLTIRDKYLDNNKAGPPEAVIFGINMILSNNRGRCYTVAEVKAWMNRQGFSEIRYEKIGGHSELVIATKR